jgi:hypothetical protein
MASPTARRTVILTLSFSGCQRRSLVFWPECAVWVTAQLFLRWYSDVTCGDLSACGHGARIAKLRGKPQNALSSHLGPVFLQRGALTLRRGRPRVRLNLGEEGMEPAFTDFIVLLAISAIVGAILHFWLGYYVTPGVCTENLIRSARLPAVTQFLPAR